MIGFERRRVTPGDSMGAPASCRRAARRGGFTLIELLVVVAIVGILAGLAIPNLRTVLIRARATEVAGDIEVVRKGVLQYNGDNLTWPAEAPVATIPPGLEEFLPDGYSFARTGYNLDFENWSMPAGLPGDPSTRRLIGVSVVVEEEPLSNALVEFLGSAILFSVDRTHTVVIDRG